jgi:hypothetical protein
MLVAGDANHPNPKLASNSNPNFDDIYGNNKNDIDEINLSMKQDQIEAVTLARNPSPNLKENNLRNYGDNVLLSSLVANSSAKSSKSGDGGDSKHNESGIFDKISMRQSRKSIGNGKLRVRFMVRIRYSSYNTNP